jgi:hypothetical protein
MGRTAYTEPQCLYRRAIPLLPLWAVRPVHSISVCTRVHFIVTNMLLIAGTEELTEGWLYLPGSKFIRLAYFSVLEHQKHKRRYKVVTNVYTQHFCAGSSCDE